jgi:cellulose synthase/poly-beta-1,6-N-acetylglucosamine synthase-like glycosyltransferase
MLLASEILILLLLFSITTSISYFTRVYQASRQLPRIEPLDLSESQLWAEANFPRVSVVIPAYNEEENIAACVSSVLSSTSLPPDLLEVWVVDDQSSDRTLEILHQLKAQTGDPRLHILSGQERPSDRLWNGKNWACQQGAASAFGDFLLFIDADVRLKPNAIPAVIQTAVDRQLDFLTCIPTIICESPVEWLVQPLIFMNLMVTFNSKVVRDPKTKATFALGPFLLFKASTYYKVGGHEAVSEHPAEDVAFARRIKHNGFRLQQFLGTHLASLRMYRNWNSLWEGWTKILYVGSQRSIGLMALLFTVMLLIYTVPWMGLLISLFHLFSDATLLAWAVAVLSGTSILLQFFIRKQGSKALGTTSRYWWLQGIGGILVALLAIASVIKTETGWGWTWRGRKLVASKKV